MRSYRWRLPNRLRTALMMITIAGALGAAAPTDRALAAIGEAPGTPWTPLAADEFFHVHSSTFEPKIEPVAGDTVSAIRSMFAYFSPQSNERWLSSTGHGTSVSVQGGGGDPTRYPRLSPDSTGQIRGMSGTASRRVDPSMYPASLRYADHVSTTSWPRGGTMRNRGWFRVPGGFRLGNSNAMSWLPGPGATLAERRHNLTWGATASQLEAVNAASGAELAAAVAKLLAVSPTSVTSYTPPGRFGATHASAAEEASVARAVALLGNAPLSAAARAAIFRWISTRSNARRWIGAIDERGRTGTRVTLQTVRHIPIPARTVTVAQLLRQGGFRADAIVAGKQSYVVPAHREFRRWNTTIVFDTRSNELLQQSLYARWETTAMLPRIQSSLRGGLRVALAVDRQANVDSAIYDARERTTSPSPAAAVCLDVPGVCR